MPITDRPQFPPRSHRAREILAEVGRAYPSAWKQVDALRAMRDKGLPAWPEWCFLPLHGAYAVASGGGDQRVPFERSHHTGIIGALAAWRVTQGIYRFDPALYQGLIDTPLDRELPREPFYRLPEWCVYMETPELMWSVSGEERPIHGVWAHLDWDERGHDELRLVLDTARTTRLALDARQGCIPMPLILGEGTIADSIERVIASGAEQARAHGMKPAEELKDVQRFARTLWPILSLLLYLCAESAEIGDGRRVPINPQPKRTRQGWRLFPTDTPTNWDVGVRIGAALRRAFQAEETNQDSIPTGRHKRPHVRRAHWHTFLAGPEKAEERERRVKWLPPIPVNVDDPALLPSTIRPVE